VLRVEVEQAYLQQKNCGITKFGQLILRKIIKKERGGRGKEKGGESVLLALILQFDHCPVPTSTKPQPYLTIINNRFSRISL